MDEPTKSPRIGEYFSRNYLRPESLQPDDPRARQRIAAYLSEYYSDDSGQVGALIEQELGIECRTSGFSGYYVEWKPFLARLSTPDFLFVVTAVIKYRPEFVKRGSRINVKYSLIDFCQRVFSEQNLAYRIDQLGGVHPAVDTEFSMANATIIRGLASVGLAAALEHVQAAEKAMLAHTFDGRHAIRVTFDAVENLTKVIDPKKTKLDAKVAKETLGNFILTNCGTSPEEKRAAGKLIDSLCNWVNSAHNYRHSPSGIEVSQPSEAFTVAFVSQGFSYIRWICDAYAARQSSATPTT